MPLYLYHKKYSDKTQALGAVVFDLSDGYSHMRDHQLAIEVSETPTAGTLTISVIPVGMTDYIDLATTIDMTNGPYIVSFSAYCDKVKITPTSFDANKTYDVGLTSGLDSCHV